MNWKKRRVSSYCSHRNLSTPTRFWVVIRCREMVRSAGLFIQQRAACQKWGWEFVWPFQQAGWHLHTEPTERVSSLWKVCAFPPGAFKKINKNTGARLHASHVMIPSITAGRIICKESWWLHPGYFHHETYGTKLCNINSIQPCSSQLSNNKAISTGWATTKK